MGVRRSIITLANQFNATAAADADTMIGNTDLEAADPYVKALKLLRDAIEDLINNDDNSNTAIGLNTAKTGITTSQASAITTNTAKTGITTSQASAITANTAKVGLKENQVELLEGLAKGILNKTNYPISIGFGEEGQLTFTINRKTYSVAEDRR